jgi:hypothetical protein
VDAALPTYKFLQKSSWSANLKQCCERAPTFRMLLSIFFDTSQGFLWQHRCACLPAKAGHNPFIGISLRDLLSPVNEGWMKLMGCQACSSSWPVRRAMGHAPLEFGGHYCKGLPAGKGRAGTKADQRLEDAGPKKWTV